LTYLLDVGYQCDRQNLIWSNYYCWNWKNK